MSLSTVCSSPSFSTRIATLFLIGYPFLLWALSTHRRDGIGPMSASVLPAMLTPLFVAVSASWLGLASVIQGISIAGGGRSARAAGVAETLALITFCAAVAALVCTATSLWDQIRSANRHASYASPSLTMSMVSVAMIVLFAILLVSHFVMVRRIVETAGAVPISTVTAITFAAVAGFGGATSLVWLVLSRRRPTLQIHSMRGVIAAASAAGAILIAYSSWYLAAIYRAIAMGG